MLFNSPWLQFSRPVWPPLTTDMSSDITIIGGGISGVATLYFLLMQTKRNVVLLEKNHMASGATGYNAGLACAFIEKPLTELIAEFGINTTRQTYEEMDYGWTLLHEVQQQINGQNNFTPFFSAAHGFYTIEDLVASMERERIQAVMGRNKLSYCLVDDESLKRQIPAHLITYIDFVAQEKILEILNTVDKSLIAAAFVTDKFVGARINSALFCYQVLSYLQQQFPTRFTIFENTYISKINLCSDGHKLYHAHGIVETKDLILCTNAYKDFTITSASDQQEVTKVTESITCHEGYLVGFHHPKQEIFACAFFDSRKVYEQTPYFYLSQAPIPTRSENMLCILGGPEYALPNSSPIELQNSSAITSKNVTKIFLQNTYNIAIEEPQYFWGGIMAYTKNNLRWVGRDQQYQHLWYNLGCNGIGILPAISGGNKIARLMNGEEFPTSLFDPPL